MGNKSTASLVTIITVTRNHLEHLEDCLKSVMNLGYPRLEIIVADNNSTDGGPEFIQNEFPSVKVLKFGKNYGFAEGNNRAIKQANGDYIFLLNPDTKIEPDCVDKLIKSMEQDRSIGICMPKMLMFNEPSVINSTGIIANEILQGRDRGAWELDCGQYDKEQQIIGACGAAMFIRRNLFERVGYFDRLYFTYYEDLDFSIRAWLAGYRVNFVPEAIVYHKYRPFRKDILNEYIDHRNRFRMMLKNMPLPTLLWMLPKSLYTDTKVIYNHLRGKRLKLAYYRLKALIWNLIVLPDTLIKRVKVQMKRVVKDKPTILRVEGLERIVEVPLPNYDVKSEGSVDGNDLDSWVKMGENDIRHLGFGWYYLESWLERKVRWTTNYGIIFLKNSLPRVAEETLQIEAFSSLLIEGTVWINGKRVGEFLITPRQWQWLHFNFFSQAQVLKVTIKCNETFVPKFDVGGKDNRTLGIAISEIGIVP